MTDHFDLNSLAWGNPRSEIWPYLKGLTYIDALYEPLKGYAFPLNDSPEIRVELNHTAGLMTQFAETEIMQLFSDMDRDIEKFYLATLSELGIKNDTFADVTHDVKSLVHKLKNFYNRPRPYQLAYYYRLKIFPNTSLSALCPAYPSLHYTLALIYTEVYGYKNPRHYKLLKELAEEVAKSRLAMGVNYRSDLQFAAIVSGKIMASEGFYKKYF